MSQRKPSITIEYVHDVVCSWCPIGLQNVKSAIEALKDEIDFDLRFLPYELNPTMPPEGEAIERYFARRSGWTAEKFKAYAVTVVEKAKAVGLTYDYSKRTHYYSTAAAHRLIHFAEQFGEQQRIVDALTTAYFTNGVNVSNIDNLVEIAASVGQNRSKLLDYLYADQLDPALLAKQEKVRRLHIQSVPSMLIDDETFIQGSNSAEFFNEAFVKISQHQQAA